MAKIVCFKILNMFETIATKVFHDPIGFTSKTEFYRAFPSTTYQWINMVAVPLGVIAMVFGFFFYMPNGKAKNMVLHDLQLILIRIFHRLYLYLHRWLFWK